MQPLCSLVHFEARLLEILCTPKSVATGSESNKTSHKSFEISIPVGFPAHFNVGDVSLAAKRLWGPVPSLKLRGSYTMLSMYYRLSQLQKAHERTQMRDLGITQLVERNTF